MSSSDVRKDDGSVTYKQLGLLTLTFTLGLISALLISNAQLGSSTAFTTVELISFTLSVILSGASIVLAVAAIALGKTSEQAVIKRSDESIRLQNEVFIKTTEALQRIEASTGVTEKRIEDIISGRAGDISHRVAQLASASRKGAVVDEKELEEQIRRSLLSEMGMTRPRAGDDERMAKLMEERSRYERFHQLVLSSFANRKDLKSAKLGHGKTSGEGFDLFDGIFFREEVVIGISAFGSDSTNVRKLTGYLGAVAKSILDGVVGRVILVFDTTPESKEKLEKDVAEFLSVYKDDPAKSVTVIAAEIETVAVEIGEKLGL